MAEALLISRNDIVKFTALNGNIDTDSFIQWIKVAQDIHIQNYLGTNLLEKLQLDVTKLVTKVPVGIQVIAQGSGYSGAGLTTTAIPPSVGSGMIVNCGFSGGSVVTANFVAQGSGYNVGDQVTIDGGNNDAILEVTQLFSILPNYLNLLNTYVKPMLIHWAMVEYLPFSAYTIANKGVFKHTSENATSVEKNEVDFLVEKERMIAQNYTERFITYINFNNSLFPEYSTNSNADMFPSTQNNFTGWYI
jgi:hypothetical protein